MNEPPALLGKEALLRVYLGPIVKIILDKIILKHWDSERAVFLHYWYYLSLKVKLIHYLNL
jgi:hypothetical protein